MRQIATLPDDDARRFADYLLTLKIQTQLIGEDGGQGLWVCDEDRVEDARRELAEFTRNPGDFRYAKAAAVAQTLRKDEARAEKQYARRQQHLEEKMAHAGQGGSKTVTILLLLASILVTLATNFGKSDTSWLLPAVRISPTIAESGKQYWYPGQGLQRVWSGEVWRLVTPIFLHLDPLHLGFNMLMLISLGGSVEAARGKLRYILLVLVLSVTSNLAEYYMSWSFASQPWFSFDPNPFFGGMSGVLYGLFGYGWMKSRYEPEAGLHMSTENVLIMLGWFLLCAFGVVGAIANVAHAAGLVVGLAIGYAPQLWKRRAAA
jgi:GlpG protein